MDTGIPSEWQTFLSVPFIAALVALFKGVLPDRTLPFLSLGVGVLFAELIASQLTPHGNFVLFFFGGLMAGLAASGLYSAGRQMTKPG